MLKCIKQAMACVLIRIYTDKKRKVRLFLRYLSMVLRYTLATGGVE